MGQGATQEQWCALRRWFIDIVADVSFWFLGGLICEPYASFPAPSAPAEQFGTQVLAKGAAKSVNSLKTGDIHTFLMFGNRRRRESRREPRRLAASL